MSAPPKIFRVVPVENAAYGRWGAGRLVVGESEEEIRTREGIEDGVFVELMTDRKRMDIHLSEIMRRRWQEEEDARKERMQKRRVDFVSTLTDEEEQTSAIEGGTS